jgi:hypothetical protein
MRGCKRVIRRKEVDRPIAARAVAAPEPAKGWRLLDRKSGKGLPTVGRGRSSA